MTASSLLLGEELDPVDEGSWLVDEAAEPGEAVWLVENV